MFIYLEILLLHSQSQIGNELDEFFHSFLFKEDKNFLYRVKLSQNIFSIKGL